MFYCGFFLNNFVSFALHFAVNSRLWKCLACETMYLTLNNTQGWEQAWCVFMRCRHYNQPSFERKRFVSASLCVTYYRRQSLRKSDKTVPSCDLPGISTNNDSDGKAIDFIALHAHFRLNASRLGQPCRLFTPWTSSQTRCWHLVTNMTAIKVPQLILLLGKTLLSLLK